VEIGRGATAEADALAAHAAACASLNQLESRAQIFERRAMERDPDKRIYGPKMSRRVLDFCDWLQRVAGHCAELGETLAPARQRQSEAEEAAAGAEVAKVTVVAASQHEARAPAAAPFQDEVERLAEAEVAASAALDDIHTVKMQMGRRRSPSESQWPELEGLTRKMARVMPRTSMSW
jgi:hypothetical protein